jgi:hypothetical protein
MNLIQSLGDSYFQRLATDVIASAILLFGIYLPNNHRNREYLFTFLMFNLVIFNIAFLLNRTEMSLGAAFGLFAVFGLLRYRTEDIPMKEMTYLLLAIALGLATAIAKGPAEAAMVSALLLIATFLLDHRRIMKKEVHKDLRFEKTDLIRPEQHEALAAELRKRTGLPIHGITIKEIDFIRDIATVRIFYFEGPNQKSGNGTLVNREVLPHKSRG